ncbi:hypothetical protein COCON_G00082200 [Conger conger]|uniref:A-kinase anchor protein 14 n=1 Tax=Conger conger TaxID=82655 RepID=A0A9Q1DPV2_CONCO|nr:A-kinase anchor protein 14 [Conger conger]KAJ8276468.1 hypothetical protein COCON_G00082200 [Conger conger]
MDYSSHISKYANMKAYEIVKTTLDNVQDTLFHQDQEEKDKNLSKQVLGPNKYEMKNIDWISCKEFTVDLGKEQIEKCINMWELDPSWLYSLTFLEEKELEFHKQYHYRALWSIPTAQTPIPKATASVYFVIEISKIKPQSMPVEVYYVVESCRLRHRPGKTSFRERWLKDIIENKTRLKETINF